MEFQRVFTATSCLELQRVLDVMTRENIPAYAQESGAGQYFQILSGLAFVEKDVYVEEGDAEKADLLIRRLMETKLEDGGIIGDKYRLPWYRNPEVVSRIFVGIFFVAFVVLFICALLFP